MPYSKFVSQHGIPYAMDNFRDEFKRRRYLRFGDADSIAIENHIKSYYESGYHTTYYSDFKWDYFIFNYEIVLCVSFIIIGFIVVLVRMLLFVFKKRYHFPN
jgi:hypothetical protein